MSIRKNLSEKLKELAKKEVFAVYKPKGWPSFRVVELLRQIPGIKKVGFLGTLDPAAEGVLVVGVGQGTKKLRFLPQEKEYIAHIGFGLETETWDLEAKNIKIEPIPQLSPKEINQALKQFKGKITQIVPAFSAKKIRGKKLYELARKGENLQISQLPRKTVFIQQIKLLDLKPTRLKIHNKRLKLPVAKVKIRCSKGTFIRSIAFELGQKLGVPATLIGLIRTKEAGFSLKEAFPIQQLEGRGNS